MSENAGRLAKSGFLPLVHTVTNKITDRLPLSTGAHRAGRFLFGKSGISIINNNIYICFAMSSQSPCNEGIGLGVALADTRLRRSAALQAETGQ